MTKFKAQSTEGERIEEAKRILEKYPDRVPVIVEKCEDKSDIQPLDKVKYLCPKELSVGQFMYVIRKRLKLSPEQAIFLFVNGNVPSVSSSMSTIYEEYKDDDGFLYMTYSGEHVFGSFCACNPMMCFDGY